MLILGIVFYEWCQVMKHACVFTENNEKTTCFQRSREGGGKENESKQQRTGRDETGIHSFIQWI